MKPIIEIQDISKKYKITHLSGGYLSFRERMMNMYKSSAQQSEDFWALKNVSFEVEQGQAIGIVGRNGAGKSTLLKILSKITPPTGGRIVSRGRIASLLEVGTGFHPELTGRENIYFNGSLLGMKRREIESKFDEIVDFSGVEKFLDTPLKHFSSGMQLRLAFAVAAFLEPEILIIDEVLAVGDAEFQKKCLGKMEDVSKSQGRTILFVSHNLATVTQLCKKAILLKEGSVVEIGEASSVVHSYVMQSKMDATIQGLRNLAMRKGSGRYRVASIQLLDGDREPLTIARTGSEIIFQINFDREINTGAGSFRIDFAIDNEQDNRVGWFSSDVMETPVRGKFQSLFFNIPKVIYGSGTYYLTVYSTWNGNVEDYIHQAFSFEVEEGDFFGTGKIVPKFQTSIYCAHKIFS